MPSSIVLAITTESTPPAPYTGPVCCVVNENQTITPLTGAQQVICRTITIPGSGTATLDPSLDDNVFGSPATMINAQVIDLKSVSGNGGNITVGPSASNGWTNLIASGAMVLEPGTGTTWRSVLNGYAVSGTNRELTLTNLDASPVDVEVLIVGED